MFFISKFPPMRHAGVVGALLILTACGGGGDDSGIFESAGPPQLHLACQTVECECRSERRTIFSDRETADIVWRLNGDATCPAGFVLERVETDFLGRRK